MEDPQSPGTKNLLDAMQELLRAGGSAALVLDNFRLGPGEEMVRLAILRPVIYWAKDEGLEIVGRPSDGAELLRVFAIVVGALVHIMEVGLAIKRPPGEADKGAIGSLAPFLHASPSVSMWPRTGSGIRSLAGA